MAFLKYSVLALRVLLWVLLASLVFFVATSSLGVLHERQKAYAAAQQSAREAVDNSLDAVSVALWQYDLSGLRALLDGMIRAEAVVRVEIGDHRGVLAEIRQPGFSGTPDTVRTVPVMAPAGSNGPAREIGFIRVAESYAPIEARLNDATGTLVATELIKIGGLAIILFVIVYRKIARHLHDLALDVSRLDPADTAPQVEIRRRKLGCYRDELDILVDAINRFLGERAEETERRAAAESNLRERISEIETTLEALTDGVVALDRERCVRYANRAARHLLGLDDYPPAHLGIDQVLTVVDAANDAELGDFFAMPTDGRGETRARSGVCIRPRQAPEFDARISAVPVPGVGDVAMIVVVTDVSGEIAKERRIEFQAFHDPLTRLGNRSMLARDLPRDIAQIGGTERSVAVLCLDLDNFKNINDTLGHLIGDVLLKQLAERFRTAIEAPGWVTRHGGDEFIVVLPGIDSVGQAAAVARRLMDDIARPFLIEQHELRVTSSIGISLAPAHGATIGQLLSCADLAMYAAKQDGKNTWRIFEDRLLKRSAQRLTMENGLRVALREGQLSLVFQPKLHIASGRVDAVEALLRWHGPNGSVPPATFIPVAEETGLINEIGAWVLQEACSAARRMRDTLGRNIAVAVNVSPQQFRGESLLAGLRALAGTHPDLHGLIEIELTESALSGDIGEVAGKLRAFREMGLRVAIDDFGTGYSSLAYLKNLPIDILKIDQAFVRELPGNDKDQAIVGAVVQLGRSLGFEIVAEGVEEAAHARLVAELGCDYAQGYWLARPLAEGELTARLQAGTLVPQAAEA